MFRQVKGIESVFGARQNLILLDNNVLASNSFERIINDIKTLGFERGARRNKRMRIVDFNQGLDARLLTPEKMHLLSQIAIRPVRIAFDNIAMKDLYVSKIHLAGRYGLVNLSNYVLYNYTDAPKDFYQRLEINCELNEELGTKIYSFPMKYIPLNAKDRTYVGRHWNKKIIRGIQCILLATHGMVPPKMNFFKAAFGTDAEDFILTTLMPNDYIIQRKLQSDNAEDWKRSYKKLTKTQKEKLMAFHSEGRIRESYLKLTKSLILKRVLGHYIEADQTEKKRYKKK